MFLTKKDNIPYVTNDTIAESLKLDIRSINRTISNYIDRLQEYGTVRFEITPLTQKKTYFLTEEQALLLATLSRNSKRVVEFKQTLVSEYAKLRRKVGISQLLAMNVQVIEELSERAKLLEGEVTKLATRDLEVKTEKEYKWKQKVVQNDRGKTINYYVKLYFNVDGNYSKAHKDAKRAYYIATGIFLPHYAKDMSMEQKKDYLEWLAKYESQYLTLDNN
jgi:phage regulator Rha-like protein